MSVISRRTMLLSAASVVVGTQAGRGPAAAAFSANPSRKFTLDLNPGAVGVAAGQEQAIQYAAQFGFESVSPQPDFLTSLDGTARRELLSRMKEQNVTWGAAGLPVQFRQDESTFRQQLKRLPQVAQGLQQAGVTRVGTWLMPCHAELTYTANFRQHTRRLKQCVRILGDHGLRFGMEYVGPKTLWSSMRHSFIHSMQETKELIAAIDEDDVGFVLDSWHWYTAHETTDDLLSLTNDDIVACDLNDAPVGLEIDRQIDNQRELPAATGVINLRDFLGALVKIGYDGPVRAEPFNAELNARNNEAACEATARAMRTAFALVGS